jgi:hypothetical protein
MHQDDKKKVVFPNLITPPPTSSIGDRAVKFCLFLLVIPAQAGISLEFAQAFPY